MPPILQEALIFSECKENNIFPLKLQKRVNEKSHKFLNLQKIYCNQSCEHWPYTTSLKSFATMKLMKSLPPLGLALMLPLN